MAVPTKIQHPLLRRPGTSQRKRIAESQLLRPEFALIDGRKLGDMLDFVYEYARLVVFHEYKIDAEGQGYVEFSNWLGFFERSLPFTLNRFAKSDFDRLETDLRSSVETIKQKPNDASLRLLLDFCYFDLIKPLNRLQKTAREYDFERLVTLLDRTARTSLLPSLLRFIKLSNAAAKYFCTTKYDFMVFNQVPWGIPIEDLFVIDETVQDIPGGQAGAIEWLSDQVTEAAQRFLVVQRDIAQEIPDFLNASIDVLEKQNDPHLGLLYAFLRLFEHFQGELNGLTQKHIEFFYTEVLQLKRRAMVPDQAHLVFEPAKHLENHRIKQGTVFKDAKDSKNVDILFDLDEEIVIDKAKVAALKTLYLNHNQGCLEGNVSNNVPRAFVEGIYIAPVANSADGKGGEFKEVQSKNWTTLGAKLSKYTAPGDIVPQNHPFGRIGFILASPVLWLNEGQRKVTITIECDTGGNTDVLTECSQKLLKEADLFDVRFSGKEGWFEAEGGIKVTVTIGSDTNDNQVVTLTFVATLGLEEPAVAFYEEKAIGEFFATKSPFPMVKIELKPEVQEECDSNCETDNCCLANRNRAAKVTIALYHFLRYLRIKDVKIEVKVCGVKNLVVQNEESLQDVNSLILPFGSRPKVGAEFYIGSKEVFCKNWQKLWLHVNWKDKPPDLEEHYKFYAYEPFEDGTLEIKEESFKFKAAVLEDGSWKERKLPPLENAQKDPRIQIFADSPAINEDNPCGRTIDPNDSSYYKKFMKDEFVGLEDEPKPLKPGALEPLSVNSDKGFFRMTLQGVGFQHDRYAFVLARKLIELSGGLDPVSLGKMRTNLDAAEAAHKLIAERIESIENEIKSLVRVIDKIDKVADHKNDSSKLMALRKRAVELLEKMKAIAYPPAPPPPGKIPPLAQFDNLLQILDSELLKLIKELKGYSGNLREIIDQIEKDLDNPDNPETPTDDESGAKQLMGRLNDALNNLDEALKKTNANVGLPKEPYTPLIKALEVDYCASADNSDIEIIHLHPLAKTSKTETLFIVETLQKYKLNLRSISAPSDLPDQGKCLIIVALDNVKLLHIRVFDDKGQRIVDKVEAELNKGQELTELKKLLQPFPDQSTLTPEKKQEIVNKAISMSQTTLLPTFTDEGTLFIGLEGLRPRSNLQLLFQFAEATADSESDRAEIKWHYLADNQWKELRTGFELLLDKTEQMTRSGIVKIALPEDISNEGNTLMPPTEEGQHLFWLKVSTPHAVAGVAELVGVHAQAALATYKPLAGSDLDRVAKTLEPEQIGKTLEPDFGIKKIEQPYKSFGGSVAEAKGAIPIRMSELLRHKGRSVDAFDIEHLVLDAFPELFKCKCISHTMGLSARQYQRDLEVAPGFLIVAVVPDLTKLEPGDMLQPMAPVSTLTKVKKFLKARVSPFARIRVKNPRYEQVHVRVKVRLRLGRDENYYLSQLKTDLCHFLAPWYLGDSDKLSFGQHLVYSNVLGFIEGLEYIDFVTDLRLFDFKSPLSEVESENLGLKEIVPLTARSILSPGDIETSSDKKDCMETPASQLDENKLVAFLKSASPITCGEAQSDLAERKPQPIPMKMRDDRRN